MGKAGSYNSLTQFRSNRAVFKTGSWPETGMWEITPEKPARIRQPHWHRHLDVKRPMRGCDAANRNYILFPRIGDYTSK